jgi:methyl-accepting chemotaxis protein
MNIQKKLIFGAMFIGFVPILIGASYIGYNAIHQGQNLIREQVQQQLISVREITAEKVEHYFSTIENQILTLSKSRMVIDAMQDFEGVFTAHSWDAKLDTEEVEASLNRYYKDEFAKQYNELNPSKSAKVQQLISGLSAETKALQYSFISNNPNPLGAKDKLLHSPSFTPYTKMHAYYHESLHDFLTRFGFYDIFLVSAKTGHIVYSVYKELDFATSLIDGPYAQSGIADVFRQVKDAKSDTAIALTGFSPYLPSYEAPAAFMASPIFESGELVGVLIFQMPIDRLNQIMTHKGEWNNVGLGDSGETYLVGQDFNMRSMSRFLLEDKDAYGELLAGMGVEPNLIANIIAKHTSVGLQTVKTKGTQAALSGNTGYEAFPDYRGVRVFSAYRPIKIKGFTWALMSEIDEAEAFQFSDQLKDSIITTSIITIILALMLAGVLGLLFSKSIVGPINRTVNMLKNIAKGDGDLTQRLDATNKDEMGRLAYWFNHFIEDIQNLISDLNNIIITLSESSSSFKNDASATEKAIDQQNTLTRSISKLMNNLQGIVDEIAQSSSDTSELAIKTSDASSTGLKTVHACTTAIETLSKDIQQMVSSIDSLNQSSKQVGEVVTVIQSIAEQTNLLALNAAIEAARAGESGRGFAVVADEVRNLAQRTQESTLEISESINFITEGISKAVDLASHSHESVQSGLNSAQEAEHTFKLINESVGEIRENGQRMVGAAKNQETAAREVNTGVQSIENGAQGTTQLIKGVAVRSVELESLSKNLNGMVGRYKTK